MTFAVENHTKRENRITWGWPGHSRLFVCHSGNLGWKEGDVTFAWCLPQAGSPQSSGHAGQGPPGPSPLGGETAEQGDSCAEQRCCQPRPALL